MIYHAYILLIKQEPGSANVCSRRQDTCSWEQKPREATEGPGSLDKHGWGVAHPQHRDCGMEGRLCFLLTSLEWKKIEEERKRSGETRWEGDPLREQGVRSAVVQG
jgi:hypothetical protein